MPGVLKALKEVMQTTKLTSQATAEIRGIIGYTECFEFIVITVIWYDVLVQVNFVSKMLQSPNMQIEISVAKLQGLLNWVSEFRNNGFKRCIQAAKPLALRWAEELNIQITPSFLSSSKRVRTITTFFDENGRDQPIRCTQKRFEVENFNVMIDLFKKEIRQRFENQNAFKKKFGFLFSLMQKEQDVKNMSEEAVLQECKKVAAAVKPNTIDANDLAQEVISFAYLPNKKDLIADLKKKKKRHMTCRLQHLRL